MPPIFKYFVFEAAKKKLMSSKTKPTGPFAEQCTDYLSDVCDAICDAHEKWRMMCNFFGARIEGSIVTGGGLAGPNLAGFILTKAPMTGLKEMAPRYSKAIAQGIGTAWDELQRSVKLPGLPWYPTFMTVNAPMAAPTANVPTPFIACGVNPSSITPVLLKLSMQEALGSVKGPLSDEIFEAVAHGFAYNALKWCKEQLVMNVLGQGPVIGFIPPVSMIGKVTGGQIIPAPGHLSN